MLPIVAETIPDQEGSYLQCTVTDIVNRMLSYTCCLLEEPLGIRGIK